MKIKNHRQIVEMLFKEWDLGKQASHAKGKTCAWIYWFEILSEAEEIIAEKENGNILGICGYSKWNSKKHRIRKKIYQLLKWLLIHSFLIKNREAIIKYDNDYSYLPKELENYFDGEITILIVDKQHRGKKIGKKLLNEVFKMAADDGMKNIQILSDESCNYKFYENLGCTKIYETLISNGEPDKCGKITSEKGFIYEKKLSI